MSLIFIESKAFFPAHGFVDSPKHLRVSWQLQREIISVGSAISIGQLFDEMNRTMDQRSQPRSLVVISAALK